MKLPPQTALVAVLGLIGGAWLWTAKQQEIGAQRVLLAQSDSLHAAAVRESIVQHDSAEIARKEAADLRRLARWEVKRDSLVRLKTDSTIKESADERSAARSTLADSLASVATLRDQLARFLRQSQADSGAWMDERAANLRTQASLLAAIRSDSTAISRGLAELAASTRRWQTAETQVGLLKAQRPSTVGNLVRAAGFVLAGVGVGRLVR